MEIEDRNWSETVGIYGNQYKNIIKKSVYFTLMISSNGLQWTIQKSMDKLHLHRLKNDSKCP